jgi:hypothetical protein
MIRTAPKLILAFMASAWAIAIAQAQEKIATLPPSVAADVAAAAPMWLKGYRFPNKKFTFVRIQYDSPVGFHRSSWATDYPEAELNLVALLGKLTNLDVSDPSRVMRLTDPEIMDQPVLYLSEPASWKIGDDEAAALRKYLEAGGFLFADDFWGEAEWEHVRTVMKRVLPDSEPVDLPLMHPLFRAVFSLEEKPQVPSIHTFVRGRTTEREDAPEAHYRAIFDDRKRMIALLCHNTDLADGWERAGLDAAYTRQMSVAKAFPMGVNILFFALTQSKPPQ